MTRLAFTAIQVEQTVDEPTYGTKSSEGIIMPVDTSPSHPRERVTHIVPIKKAQRSKVVSNAEKANFIKTDEVQDNRTAHTYNASVGMSNLPQTDPEHASCNNYYNQLMSQGSPINLLSYQEPMVHADSLEEAVHHGNSGEAVDDRGARKSRPKKSCDTSNFRTGSFQNKNLKGVSDQKLPLDEDKSEGTTERSGTERGTTNEMLKNILSHEKTNNQYLMELVQRV